MAGRNAREAKTLCRALDLLAKKEAGPASDLLGQHLKALEKSLVDGDWSRAQFLERLPPEGMTLVDRDEDLMVQKENEVQSRINGERRQTLQEQPRLVGDEIRRDLERLPGQAQGSYQVTTRDPSGNHHHHSAPH